MTSPVFILLSLFTFGIYSPVYLGLLNCRVGRESSSWIDFDFFGHQITAHVSPAGGAHGRKPIQSTAMRFLSGILAFISHGKRGRRLAEKFHRLERLL